MNDTKAQPCSHVAVIIELVRAMRDIGHSGIAWSEACVFGHDGIVDNTELADTRRVLGDDACRALYEDETKRLAELDNLRAGVARLLGAPVATNSLALVEMLNARLHRVAIDGTQRMESGFSFEIAGPPRSEITLPDEFAVLSLSDHGVYVSTNGERALMPDQARDFARQIIEAADAADNVDNSDSTSKFAIAGKMLSEIEPGLYRLHWKAGGFSLAAVGLLHDGVRWFAPVNWTGDKPSGISCTDWSMVEGVTRIEAGPLRSKT